MPPPLFHRILVANRGEVAARVARACDALGITPVFAVSEADRDAPYTRDREVVVIGPPRAAHSYLDPVRVVQAAVQTDCSALHPGWGFLSENPLLSSLCAAHGVSFIGPPAQVTTLMGAKNSAKRAMRAAGLAVIPGSDGPLPSTDDALRVAAEVGFPVLFKAERGGGGRGMRIARDATEVANAFAEAQAEARAAFGGDEVYLERLIEGGRHVEIQVLADHHGGVVHLGERDCTVQRNHQKLLEESPSPAIDPTLREATCRTAAAAAARIGYVGAGTMEMLLDTAGPAPVLRFMEMNCRLQVEHPVSEERSGVDLVIAQIEVAAGQRLGVTQADVDAALAASRHTIECRINAEDPTQGFRPTPGRITRWRLPAAGDGVRFDTHVEEGYLVPPHYDSLLCKAIVTAEDRDRACDRMIEVLRAIEVEGVATTIPMHLAILASPELRTGRYDTRSIPGWT
jgi:acetyl-CoA carboxylase, biotin carboxylase subunit